MYFTNIAMVLLELFIRKIGPPIRPHIMYRQLLHLIFIYEYTGVRQLFINAANPPTIYPEAWSLPLDVIEKIMITIASHDCKDNDIDLSGPDLQQEELLAMLTIARIYAQRGACVYFRYY